MQQNNQWKEFSISTMRTIVLLHFEYKLYLASAKQLFPLEAKFEERIKNTEQPLNYFTNYSQTFRLIKHLGASQLACDTDLDSKEV